MLVIDVSEHQDIIDWGQAKDRIEGAIIRLGYGSDYQGQDDVQARRNIDECKRLCIPWGAYIYSYAHNDADAISEFNHAMRVLDGDVPALGLWFDTEESGCESASWGACFAFCGEAHAAGFFTGVYTFQSWYWENLVGIESSWPIWGASYGDSCTIPGISAWQYTSNGCVDGIEGRVDCSEWYIPIASGSWVQDSTGWWYRRADGTWPCDAWESIAGKWYSFNDAGYMRTGWFSDEGCWYYLGSDGAMRTGWIQDDGKWYYLQSNGAMATGWVQTEDGSWYYTDTSGAMQVGWVQTGGNWYWSGDDGAIATGTVKAIGDTFYAFDENGVMQPHALKMVEVKA